MVKMGFRSFPLILNKLQKTKRKQFSSISKSIKFPLNIYTKQTMANMGFQRFPLLVNKNLK